MLYFWTKYANYPRLCSVPLAIFGLHSSTVSCGYLCRSPDLVTSAFPLCQSDSILSVPVTALICSILVGISEPISSEPSLLFSIFSSYGTSTTHISCIRHLTLHRRRTPHSWVLGNPGWYVYSRVFFLLHFLKKKKKDVHVQTSQASEIWCSH